MRPALGCIDIALHAQKKELPLLKLPIIRCTINSLCSSGFPFTLSLAWLGENALHFMDPNTDIISSCLLRTPCPCSAIFQFAHWTSGICCFPSVTHMSHTNIQVLPHPHMQFKLLSLTMAIRLCHIVRCMPHWFFI